MITGERVFPLVPIKVPIADKLHMHRMFHAWHVTYHPARARSSAAAKCHVYVAEVLKRWP